MADFSDDTPKSITNEVQSSGSFSSSRERQLWSYDSESEPESEDITTDLEDGGRTSEISDVSYHEMKLTRKWIDCLKRKAANSGQYRADTKLQSEVAQLSPEELNALQSFCTTKINLIHHRVNSKRKPSNHEKPRFRSDADTSAAEVLNCTVPDEFLNRLYLENTRLTLKQMAIAKQHISSQCSSCNIKRAELAESAFLKQKKTLLQSHLLREKIDEHLYTKDFLTLIGEAHQNFPKLSDDSGTIWKRLNEKSQIGYLIFKGQIQSRCTNMD